MSRYAHTAIFRNFVESTWQHDRQHIIDTWADLGDPALDALLAELGVYTDDHPHRCGRYYTPQMSALMDGVTSQAKTPATLAALRAYVDDRDGALHLPGNELLLRAVDALVWEWQAVRSMAIGAAEEVTAKLGDIVPDIAEPWKYIDPGSIPGHCV
jgi:hypothetical protein